METATATTETASLTNQAPYPEYNEDRELARELYLRLNWRSNPLTWFDSLLPGGSWAGWKAFLGTLFGRPLSRESLDLYRKCTGRENPPSGISPEAWMIVGRRGGKSRVSALIACYLASVMDYTKYLAAGEVATVMVIAQDRKQSRTVMRYIKGCIDESPRLRAMVTGSTVESVSFANRVVIEVHTCSFRAVRGYTIAAVICDEIAFWRADDSSNPDAEVLNALKPAMSTIPNAMMLAISSPYARRGAMWNAYKKHFGKEGAPVLVWQADTFTMNPDIDPSIIERAYEDDPASAAAEYGAEFRRDIETFIQPEIVEECTVPGRKENPPVPGIKYRAFIDPSGGSADSFTMAIAHSKDGREVLDLVREKKPPFSPETTVKEFADTMKFYGISTAKSDYYAGEWPREQFRKHGISVKSSDHNKSEIYLELLPLLNSRKAELLDNQRLHSQLLGLERRTSRSGKDSVDHAPGAHDDVVNAAAGALSHGLLGPSGGASTKPMPWEQ